MSMHVAQSSSLPGPSVFDGWGGGLVPFDTLSQTTLPLPSPPVQQQGLLYLGQGLPHPHPPPQQRQYAPQSIAVPPPPSHAIPSHHTAFPQG